MSVCTRKNGIIFVNWMEDGKQKRKQFGRGVQAMAEAVRHNARVTSPVARVRQRGPVFVELANEYLAAKVATLPATSIDNLIYKLKGSILPLIGQTDAILLDHAALDKYVAERSKSVKMTTVHRELSDVRAIMNFAVKRQVITRNPAAGYEMPKRDDAIIQPLGKAEIEAIIANSPEHLQRAILLSYFCGLRPGAVELLSITYSQVNWSAGSIMIVSAKKGGALQREIPLHIALPLRAWYEADGCDQERHIITWKGSPVKEIKTSWASAKRRAGVSGRKLPLYAIRHSFVTTLLHLGVDMRTVADMAGHDVSTMMKHYAHTMGATRQSAISKMPEITHLVGAQLEQKKEPAKQEKANKIK